MSVRKILSVFSISLLFLTLSTTVIFAGGKQEKSENTQTTESEETKQADEQKEPEQASGEQNAAGTPIITGETLPAATVNGEPISQSDFQQLLGFLQFQYMQQGMQVQGPQLDQLKEAVLESLIDDELIYQIAVNEGYSMSQQELDEALSKTKEQFGSEEAYQDALKKEGLDEGALKMTLRKRLTRDKYETENFIDAVSVESDEIKSFYEENPGQFEQPFQFRSSHILIQVAPDATEEEKQEAMDKINAARLRIEEGEEFSEVARDVSEGPSGPNGGDLNYHGKGDFVPEFENAALELEIGAISEVVETQFGYHIIKLTDRREAQVVPFEDVEGQIAEYLTRVKAQEKRSSFLQERKPGADITRNALNS